MIKLTKEQVVSIHSSLIKASGGTDGVRDEGLLESALESPFQTFDGHDIYPSIIQKAARIGYSLVSNHSFIDGNKRIGIHIMLVFLAINGIDISCTQEDLIKIGLSLADGTMTFEELSAWLSSHN
ncbi:MAG TPA: type II toxin-antitoxin system death-on-curing family toxin [Eubacterium sp.]|jgi:death-on-curing protein|nr:type II toxin-antitoxin system death-on-curing family toxin [Eubacterium sp.]